MKIKYPVCPSAIPRAFLEVTLSQVPLPLVPVNADEGPMLHLCLDIGGPTSQSSHFRSSVSFAARSYFRPSDVGVIMFNVRATVDFPIYSLVV